MCALFTPALHSADGYTGGGALNQLTDIARQPFLQFVYLGDVAKAADQPAASKKSQNGWRPASQCRRLEASDHVQKFRIINQSLNCGAGFFVRVGTDGVEFLHECPVLI